MFWIYSIWKNRKKIDINYDIIISVSLPFSSHIAAYIINRGNNKKWIMDIGDPFSLKNNAFENNRYLYKSLNYYFENKFYKKADQVVFTHQESANEHKKFFNIPEKKDDKLTNKRKGNVILVNSTARLNFISSVIKPGAIKKTK